MYKTLLGFPIFLFFSLSSLSQVKKQITSQQQIWIGHFSQTRITDKFELSSDFHLRSKDHFTKDLSQVVLRMGLTYRINDAAKLTSGFAYIHHFPADAHKRISRPEYRPWQQVQWSTKFTKTYLSQRIRLEERYRRRIENDSTRGQGYNFNFRIRYYLLYEIPLSRKPSNKFSLVLNDEVHFNFGKEIVYNYFDQNRLFAGVKINTGRVQSVHVGYMNLFQQLPSGNRFRNNHALRIFYYQNLDFRKQKT